MIKPVSILSGSDHQHPSFIRIQQQEVIWNPLPVNNEYFRDNSPPLQEYIDGIINVAMEMNSMTEYNLAKG